MSKRKLEATRANAAKAGTRQHAHQARRTRRSGPPWGRIAALVLVVGAIAAGAAVLLLRDDGGGSSSKAAFDKLVADGTCTQKEFKDTGRADHTQNVDEKIKYASDPPTAGRHYETPAPWGLYDKDVPHTVLVHNLEHGGIVVYYGPDVPAAEVDALRANVSDDRDLMLVTPGAEYGGDVKITAWTHLISCKGFQPDALAYARDSWRGKGPELVDPMVGRQANW